MELEGVEPSSKQGTNLLSTCLSSPSLSGMSKTEATNSNRSLFISDKSQDLSYPISDLSTPPFQQASKPRPLGDVLSSHLMQRLSYIYYDSIKQQERNFFRQLKFLTSEIIVLADYALHAYKPLHLAVKTSQPQKICVK